MRKILFTFVFLLILFSGNSFPCNVCGGGTGDVFVLALDGKALFNTSFLYDNYLGVWDGNGKWRSYDYSQTQVKSTLGAAYRINTHMQFSIALPFVFNNRNAPGLKPGGSGLGDISINGRYEFFHEFQIKKVNNKPRLDNVLPYLALTFGLTLPTGMSTENAVSDIDVTGKGFYTTSLGISLIKTIMKNRLVLSTDLSWQHSFTRTFDKDFGISTTPYKKQQGDKVNYSASLNYIFSSEHAFAVSVSGYSQTPYSLNTINADGSAERSLSFAAAYTFYPTLQFRITPSFKWVLTGDNMGRNSTGSTTMMLSLTYYIPEKITKK